MNETIIAHLLTTKYGVVEVDPTEHMDKEWVATLEEFEMVIVKNPNLSVGYSATVYDIKYLIRHGVNVELKYYALTVKKGTVNTVYLSDDTDNAIRMEDFSVFFKRSKDIKSDTTICIYVDATELEEIAELGFEVVYPEQ